MIEQVYQVAHNNNHTIENVIADETLALIVVKTLAPGK